MELLRRLIGIQGPFLLVWGAVLGLGGAGTGCSEDSSAGMEDSLTVVQDWSFEAALQREPATPSRVFHLDTVQVSSTAEGHRVVFGFREGALPGITVRRTEAPFHQCGSGRPLELGGQEVLEVQFAPARAYTEAGSSTLAKREWKEAFADGGQASIACDFEGHLVWALGLPSSATYRVLSDSTRGRLAVDVRW